MWTHLLLELETLPLVLVLQLVLLHLDALQGLDAALDFGRETLDVARTAADETRKLALDKAEHGRLHAASSKLIVLRILRGLCVLGNIRYCRTREACGDGGVVQGGVLRSRGSGIVHVDWDGSRHGC